MVTATEERTLYGDDVESETLRQGPKQGAVMMKTIAAIIAAAAIAAIITVISAPIGDVVASPLPKPSADASAVCNQNPWPYVNCVGTELRNSRIRLIRIDNPSS